MVNEKRLTDEEKRAVLTKLGVPVAQHDAFMTMLDEMADDLAAEEMRRWRN